MSQFEELQGVMTKDQILANTATYDEATPVQYKYGDISFQVADGQNLNAVQVMANDREPVILDETSLDRLVSAMGFPHKYLQKIPRDRRFELLIPHLNYWYPEHSPDEDLRLLVVDGRSVMSIPRADFEHISVAALIEGIEETLGDHNVLGYHKPFFAAKGFQFSLLTDHSEMVINDHVYNAGIRVQHSIDAQGATSVEPYLFNQWCTNGCTHDHNIGNWRRRGAKLGLSQWLQESVIDAIMVFDQEVENLTRLAGLPVPHDAEVVLNKMMDANHVPAKLQIEVNDQLLSTGMDTMYDVYQALTAVETHNNYFDDHPNFKGRLNGLASHLSHHTTFCPTCNTQMDEADSLTQLNVVEDDDDNDTDADGSEYDI